MKENKSKRKENKKNVKSTFFVLDITPPSRFLLQRN